MVWKEWAHNEVVNSGLLDKDSPYKGYIGKCLLELIEVFDAQKHSGYSARLTLELFDNLVRWKPLNIKGRKNEL